MADKKEYQEFTFARKNQTLEVFNVAASNEASALRRLKRLLKEESIAGFTTTIRKGRLKPLRDI